MKKLISRLLLIVFTLEGCAAIILIFMERQHTLIPYSRFTLFYKTSSLSLIGLVFTFSLIGFLLVLLSIFSWEKYYRLQQKIIDFVVNKRNSTLIISLSLLIIYVAGQLIIQTQDLKNPLQGSFLFFTQPAWLWLIIICFEIIILIFMLRSSGRIVINRDFFSILLIFLLLSLTWYGLTRLGFGFSAAAENSNFDKVGNPILGYQVVLAVVFVVLFYFLEKPALAYIKTHQWMSQKHFDILIAAFIFIGAILIWNKTPLNSNPFIDQPRPPNFEYYPDSDALLYDRTAQSLLARGSLLTYLEPVENKIGLRPAFTTMLGIFHSVGGVGYEDIIPFQIFVYAWLPVLIFFFTSTIHSRTSGLLAAILVIIRDCNGQLLENIDAGVHVKMIMSDTPMIMGLILFMILFMKWLRSEDNSLHLPLLSGGVLGFSMLFRPEVLVMLPIAGLIYLVYQKKGVWSYIKNGTLLVVGMVLVIFPWMWRNYNFTGEIFLSSPGKLIRFSDTLYEIIDEVKNKLSDQSLNIPEGYSFIDTDNWQGEENWIEESGNGVPYQLYLKAPFPELNHRDQEGTSELILNHISNSLLQSVLFLPSNPVMLNLDYLSRVVNGNVEHYYDGFLYSPQKYVKALPYWSLNWDGVIPTRSLLLLEFNLVLLSIGFLTIRKRYKPAFWILIITFLSFVFQFSLIKQSGGRIIYKVDWIILILFSIGIIEVYKFIKGKWDGKAPAGEEIKLDSQNSPTKKYHKYYLYFIPVVLLLVGSVPPAVELLSPNQFPESGLNGRVSSFLGKQPNLLNETEAKVLHAFVDGGGEVVWGRALYPRQFYPGETLSDTRSSISSRIERTHLSRFEFFLTGSKNVWVVLLREEAPEFFPHGSSVLVFGCKQRGGVDALVVAIQNGNDEVIDILWRDGELGDLSECPLTISDHWAHNWIKSLSGAGLTPSYQDGTYRPENPVTRAEMSIFLQKGIGGSGFTPPTSDGSHPYTDIANHWAEAWIEELYDTGMTGGYSDSTYRPENQVTRAEIAVFLLKAKHGNTYTPPAPSGRSFSDVAGHWAESWIEQLAAEGITSGYLDGTFKPDRMVTWAEMAVFLVNTFGLPIL